MKTSVRYIFALLLSFCFFSTLSANNVQITDVSVVYQSGDGAQLRLSFNLAWDNAWNVRDIGNPNNNDGVYIFAKYRIDVNGDNDYNDEDEGWYTLQYSLHTAGTYYTDNIGNVTSLGQIFYSRDKNLDGIPTTVSSTVAINGAIQQQLHRAALVSGYQYEVKIMGIEMVYVPQQAYLLGDGMAINTSLPSTYGRIHTPNTESGMASVYYPNTFDLNFGSASARLPFNETSTKVEISYSGRQIVNKNNIGGDENLFYPMGYQTFWVMKTEVTQAMYVSFLSTLTQAQFDQRYQNPNGVVASSRYGLSGTSPDNVSTSSPHLPMNYVSWDDMKAYLDWAGLRPMSEAEFVKVSRGPAYVGEGDYVWGDEPVMNSRYTISNLGFPTESIAGIQTRTTNIGNAIYTYSKPSIMDGPVRVGIFATDGVSISDDKYRERAGAAYFGALDLSGNLAERVVSLGNEEGRKMTTPRADGSISDTGSANESTWPSGSGTILKGGSFKSTVSDLQVSTRYYFNLNVSDTTSSYRAPHIGFRGVISR